MERPSSGEKRDKKTGSPESAKGGLSHREKSPDMERLPIQEYEGQIKEVIAKNDNSIIVGETGSGKTTQIPLFLLETAGPDKKIAVTQPRRVAARSVSQFVANKRGSKLGAEVGYEVRFDDQTDEGTRINFMTDGILLQKLQRDPILSDYSVVMVDEAHERSLNIDFSLGLLKRAQAERTKVGLEPLKIIVTSATLEKEKFAGYFGKAPIVEVPGRLHPVEVFYLEQEVEDYTKMAATAVESIAQRGKEGDILIFMPGKEEIDKTIEEIKSLNLSSLEILPIYGQMSSDEQDKIFKKYPVRKVIVATNIAETSLTVPGITSVIDSGLIKQMEYDPQTGISSLVTKKHAQSGCEQRKGRAGRLSPGECYRLYTEDDLDRRVDYQVPEIQRSNLSNVVLRMKKIGIDDIESFEFIDPPSPEALKGAMETLRALNAIDEHGKLTTDGELMAELPLEPHIAKMVVEADKYKCVDEICTIASFLGGRSVFVRPKEKESEADMAHYEFKVGNSDFASILKVWSDYEANHYSDSWARGKFLNARVLAEARSIRYQLFSALKRNEISASTNKDMNVIGKSVVAGLIESLMERQGMGFGYRRVRDNTFDFFVHPSSASFKAQEKFLVSAEIVKTKKTYARMCQPVRPEWIKEVAPHLVRESRPSKPQYDYIRGGVFRTVDFYFKNSQFSDYPYFSERTKVEGEEATQIFASLLARGEIFFPFADHNRKVMRELNASGQSYSIEELEKFYQANLSGITSTKELDDAIREKRINLELDINNLYKKPSNLSMADQLKALKEKFGKRL